MAFDNDFLEFIFGQPFEEEPIFIACRICGKNSYIVSHQFSYTHHKNVDRVNLSCGHAHMTISHWGPRNE